MSKRFNSTSLAVGPLGNLGDLSTSLNPYEKWSNGSDKMFDHHTSDSILELSSKLLTLGKWDLLLIISALNTVCQNKGPGRVHENRKIQRSFQGSFG